MEDVIGQFEFGSATGFTPFGWQLPNLVELPEDPAGISADQPRRGQVYGACSIEAYRAAGALYGAHRDAGGFLQHVDSYVTPDFWRRDAGVKSWIYDSGAGEGAAARNMDTVRVFYHAGHGRIDPTGVFHLPMGALWSGTDASLTSEQMSLGARNLRYLFWSASDSLCVADGHSPMRSWARANAGLRMMFGFGSSSWDAGDYGANFWRHWQMGKPLSQSWLDGATDVSHDQMPVVSACGASCDEATETLFGERYFRDHRARGEWWAWRWHEPLKTQQREPVLAAPPAEFQVARLVPAANDMALADSVVAALDLAPLETVPDGMGRMATTRGNIRLQRRADGRILLELHPGWPPGSSRSRVPLQRRAIVNRARSALRRNGFALQEPDLLFDRIALAKSAAASLYMMGEPVPETLDEIIVQFRQSIGGIPILTPGTGLLRLAMRPDGTVLRIEAALRRVAELGPACACHYGDPDDVPPPAAGQVFAAPDFSGIDHVLARRSARLMRDLAARGAAPLAVSVLPGTTEIGYGIRSNTARLVARQGIEIECARGFRKRCWIQSDLGD